MLNDTGNLKSFYFYNMSCKEYFPINETLTEILKIYEEIFNVDIIELNTSNVWHSSVKHFEISINGELVFSKFEKGDFPTIDDIESWF